MFRSAVHVRAALCLLAGLLLVAGCTRVGLVYRHLDTLIPWSVDDYVDMTGDQERDFKAYLRQHLAWHCTTELPKYIAWLERLERNPVTKKNLRARYDEAREAMIVVAREITPSTVELLRRLDDAQVRDMFANLEEDQRKRIKENLEPALDEQIEERAERMEKRLSDWLGSLSKAQRQRILQWSHALGERNQRWLANRARWQQAFREAVEHRQADDFPERIARLLQDRESFWTEDYRQSFRRTEAAGIELAVDLYAMADARQREHLVRRINDIRGDLANLDCLNKAP